MNLGVREKSDERILGGGEFVEQVLKEVDLANKYRLTTLDRQKSATRMVESCCKDAGIHIQALSGGSRQRKVSKARQHPACKLTEESGLSFAETARFLGVSTSAVAKSKMRKKGNKSH